MSDQTPHEAISVALELSDSFSAEEVSRQIIDAISAAGYEIVRKRPVSGGCALDMDAMERRARWYVTAGIPPQLASAYTDVLAIIARVRELEAGLAAERKRCADAAYSRTGVAQTSSWNRACLEIAAAIERSGA